MIYLAVNQRNNDLTSSGKKKPPKAIALPSKAELIQKSQQDRGNKDKNEIIDHKNRANGPQTVPPTLIVLPPKELLTKRDSSSTPTLPQRIESHCFSSLTFSLAGRSGENTTVQNKRRQLEPVEEKPIQFILQNPVPQKQSNPPSITKNNDFEKRNKLINSFIEDEKEFISKKDVVGSHGSSNNFSHNPIDKNSNVMGKKSIQPPQQQPVSKNTNAGGVGLNSDKGNNNPSVQSVKNMTSSSHFPMHNANQPQHSSFPHGNHSPAPVAQYHNNNNNSYQQQPPKNTYMNKQPGGPGVNPVNQPAATSKYNTYGGDASFHQTKLSHFPYVKSNPLISKLNSIIPVLPLSLIGGSNPK